MSRDYQEMGKYWPKMLIVSCKTWIICLKITRMSQQRLKVDTFFPDWRRGP